MKKAHKHSVHDAAFKSFMSQVENAKDFFHFHLPEHISTLCDFNTLTLTNSSFVDKQLRSWLSDVLYSVQTTEGDGYIYLLVEHQSTPDKLMAWRLMHYAFLAMNQHLQQGHKDLPLVVPILFYHGDTSPYPYSQLWTDCFPLASVANQLYTGCFPLVDVTVVDDNDFINFRKVAIMELVMKHKHLRDKNEHVISLIAQAINRNYNTDSDVITILNYLFATIDTPNVEEVVQQLCDQVEKYQEAIMSIAQRLQDKGIKVGWEKGHQQGLEEGIEKGIEKGKYEANLATARALLKNGISLELIMESTGLSREDLISLQ
nr:Rpn family recombination-promoting nuclease/putative transposase [Providencia stuartii]ELR5082375.1 Rpn family recombination-promoting nuclease/putative transposase [Providencia stuartii]